MNFTNFNKNQINAKTFVCNVNCHHHSDIFMGQNVTVHHDLSGKAVSFEPNLKNRHKSNISQKVFLILVKKFFQIKYVHEQSV